MKASTFEEETSGGGTQNDFYGGENSFTIYTKGHSPRGWHALIFPVANTEGENQSEAFKGRNIKL